MIVACATDDGINFVSRHFGDAKYYYVYKVKYDSIDFIEKINNTTEEEEEHADPKKAKGVVSLLKELDVNVAITKIFGPNIKRITKHLLPIIAKGNSIEHNLRIVQENYNKVNELIKSEHFICLNLKTNKEVTINVQ